MVNTQYWNSNLHITYFYQITEYKPTDIQRIEDNVKFRCAHCQDQWIENFNTPKDVYSHWKSWHKNEIFQYVLIEIFACYHCKITGTYHELIRHHKKKHHTEAFVIVTQKDHKKCALCSYDGKDIVEHSKAMHRIVLKTLTLRNSRSVDSPNQISNTMLNKHLAIKVNKRFRCGICTSVFETDRELRAHHTQVHKPSKFLIKEIYDNHGSYFRCSHCNESIDRSLLLVHFELHAYKFKCLHYSNKITCNFQAKDIIELVNHDKNEHGMINSLEYRCLQFQKRLKTGYLKSKVVFGNGLVTTKQKLINSKFDDSKEFYQFVNNLVNRKRQRFNQ